MDKYKDVYYPSHDEKEMKKSTRWAAVGFAALFVVLGILSKVFYAWFAGLLLGVAMLYEKKMYVTGRGLEIQSSLVVKLHHEVWTFEEIESIHQDPKYVPGMRGLIFMKGLSGKRLLFTRDHAEKIVQMAREINPSIEYHEVK